MNLKIFADGGARGNPGPAAIGVIIKLKIKVEALKIYEEKTIHQFGKGIGVTTNNIAEYVAVIEGLKWLRQSSIINDQPSIINFYLDSKLVVNQLNGVFKMKNPKLRELLFKVRKLEQEIKGEIFYHFVHREKNPAHFLVEKVFRRHDGSFRRNGLS